MSVEKARIKHLLDNFKLTPEQWQRVFNHQQGVCFGCGRPNATGKRLSSDHDHDTGEFRGLLCSRCNPLLGKIENAFKRYGLHKLDPPVNIPELLRRLANYVEFPPARAALGYAHIGYAGRVNTKSHRKMLKKIRKKMKTSAVIPLDPSWKQNR